jgi:lysozyme
MSQLACIPAALALFASGNKLDFNKLYNQLDKHVGKRAKVDLDTQRIKTIGIGFNLERAGAQKQIWALSLNYHEILFSKKELSESEIQALFKADADESVKASRKNAAKFDEIPEAKQRVVIDMVFNLGLAGFSKFQKLVAALKKRDWMEAAYQMDRSAWYGQVGIRAKTLVKTMRNDGRSIPLVKCGRANGH